MASRDSQTVILSRQTIVLVTAVGVGLLTLCYVLGVQVGKQSAALRHPTAKGAGEDLMELPVSVAEQLKAFEHAGAGLEKARPATAPEPPKTESPVAGEPPVSENAKPAPESAKATSDKKANPEKKPAAGPQWSLQLVSTPDAAEAQRMAAKAKGAGFPTVTITDKGLYKVRLTEPGTREAMDAKALKLRNRGYKPFAIRTE
jgi:cell division septation protein DedD